MSNTGLEFLKKLGGMMLLVSMLVGCYDDGVEGDSYYVFEGQTIGDYLDADSRYSEFSVILERAGMKGLMYAYGDYTCFAPTNEAVEHYINSYFPGATLETLPDSAVEAVAKSHLIGAKYMTSDFSTGYLQEPYTATGQKVPSARKFGYTVFVEKDDVFKNIYDPQNMGKPVYTGDLVSDMRSLFNYAKSIYDKVYPEDASLYDGDYTHPKNPLNRFMAYHIMDRNAGYSDLVVTTNEWSVEEGGNITEYYETMAGTLIRLEKVVPGERIYLNRCVDSRRPSNYMEGIEVSSSGGSSTVNGNFQFIGGVLSYNENVTTMLRTERIRIDTGSLLPELTNNNIRFDPDETMAGWYCPDGYFDDVYYDNQTICYYSRWPQGQDAGHSDLANFKTDNMKFNGEYDVTLRLPAVPAGPYEIRIGYEANGLMSITQIYFGYDRDNMTPTGIPLDMNMVGSDPKVGMIQDAGLFDDINMDPIYNTGGQTTITENDKAMRNLGYMKGPYAMYRVNADRVSKGARITNNLRHIVTTQELNEKPFYLRFRKVDERSNRILNIDFVEIVPRSVYNGATLEDRN